MNPRYPDTAARAAHRCEYCRAPEVAFNFPFEVEHVIPTNQGGADRSENVALSCRSCNIYKADHLNGIDPASGESVRLFHPRIDRWVEHFAATDDDSIVGITPIGRATVSLLRMNSPVQVQARRWWRALQLFP